MADLDTLRPEVREAIRDLAIAARMRPEYQQPVGIIRAELLRLAHDCKEHAEWRQLNHQAYFEAKHRAEKTEAELAATKAMIAEAPAAVVQGAPGAVKASFHGYACFEYAAENLQSKLRGKRVRLVVEE